MGMYVNETTVLCMTPHFAGTSDDYYRDTVVVGVALNGQDFGENLSHAEVTFVGTGSNTAFWQFVIAALLIALLLLACATETELVAANASSSQLGRLRSAQLQPRVQHK